MKTNRVDACRELYRGSFKRAQIVAIVAGMVALAVLIPAQIGGYLPGQLPTSRIVVGAFVVYALALVMMMWIPGRAVKESRRLDDADGVASSPSQV